MDLKFVKTVYAVERKPLGTIKPGSDFGAFLDKTFSNIGEAASSFNTIVSNVITVITIAASVWFLFQFVFGSFSWLTSGGDKTALQNAQHRITNGLIGLVLITASFAIISLISAITGLKILNPQEIIQNLGPR